MSREKPPAASMTPSLARTVLVLPVFVFEVIALELGVEAIAFAVGDAHNSIAVHDEVVELGAGLHRDVA